MTKRGRINAGAIMQSVERGEIAGLNRAGGFVRGIAKRSITTGKAHAPPGEPPKQRRNRPGGSFNKSIAFIVDRQRLSVDIGAAPDKATKTPATLEHGGPVVFTLLDIYRDEKQSGGPSFRRLKERLKTVDRNDLTRKRTTQQKARPFMTAALFKFKEKAAQQFKNILK